MSYYDEEFYGEPSEFDLQVDEFKQALMKSVKTDYVAKMERLEKENAELQEVKVNFDKIKNDFQAKERQMDYDRQHLERKVRGTRFAELMKDLEVTLWKADWDRVLDPKCDMCDSQRKVEFISPLGKKMKEECSCNTSKDIYKPVANILKEFKSRDGKMTAWYSQYRDDGDGFTLSSSTVVRIVYVSGMDFEQLDNYSTFFRDKEDCQKYCDWLTEQKK